MPDARPPVLMRLPAVAGSLTVARQVVAGVAMAAGMDGEPVEDVRIAVTEACANVARHASAVGAASEMELVVWVDDGLLFVAVRDEGAGLADPGDAASPSGVGLVTMRALARAVALVGGPDGGTEVVMSFAIGDDGSAAA